MSFADSIIEYKRLKRIEQNIRFQHSLFGIIGILFEVGKNG